MDLDRLKAAIYGIIEQLIGTRLDYLARYPATVKKQSANGTLHVKPDDERIPGLVDVPIRTGIPGAEIKVENGARVLLAFEGGRPDKPIADLWESGSIEELKIVPNGLPVARQGDMVACGGMNVGVMFTQVLPPPPATSPVPMMTSTVYSMTFAPVPGAPGTPLYGQITTGNQKVKS